MVTAGATLGGAGTASARAPETAPAQTAASPVQRATLVGEDSDDGDRFGQTMATDGGTALIGAIADEDPNGENAGSVYVFERDGGSWTQTAKLASDDGDDGDLFGSAIAVDGDTALVGARQAGDPATGAAYVFERDSEGWEQVARLIPDATTADAVLGWSVALVDGTALVGAPRDSTAAENAGTVFAFESGQEGWEQRATLTAEEASEGAFFGTALEGAGDTAVVGAAGASDPNGEQAGTAYIFEREDDGEGGWSQAATLVPDDGDDGDLFGTAAAFDGETALVAAVSDEDPNGSGAGSVYAFQRAEGGWTQAAKLASDDGAEGDEFGWAVDLAGETALIGARRTDGPNGDGGGAAYLFGNDGDEWTQRAKVAPEDATEGARAGSSVALAGETALLGAPNAATAAEDGDVGTGSVSVFDLTGESTPTPTATPTPTPTPTQTPGEDGPGFGVVAALSGLAGWLWWRHSR